MDGAAAERRLRLQVEELLAQHRDGVAADVMAALDAFEAAALALVGAGVLGVDRGTALVAEAVDALVARGATWLEPSLPDLDVTRLYDAAAGGGRARLRQVIAVATTLTSGTITSVELWSDRAVARVVDGEGCPAPSHVVGAAGVDDRRLDLRDGGGGVVSIDLAGGRAVREVPGAVVAATVERHLAAMVALEVAAATGGDEGVDQLNAARNRLVAAVEALDPASAGAVIAGFDAAVAVPATDRSGGPPLLLEVVPVAQRFFGGWLTSIELWSDHWRAIVVDEEGAPRRRWTAVGTDGHRSGALVVAPDILRFAPGLDLEWTSVVLEGHGGGEVLELEVRR